MRLNRWSILLLLAFVPGVLARTELPHLDELMPKIVARAKAAETNSYQKVFSYKKKTVTEDFDSSGVVAARKEDVSAHLAGAAAKKKKKSLVKIDEEVLEKFDFTLVDRVELGHRPALVLRFTPKQDRFGVSLQDQVGKRVSGRIWIDEQDLEIAKVEAHLDRPVRIIGGLIAALEQFSYVLVRQRLNDGDWVPEKVETQVRGRKFLSEIHTRKEEFWEQYEKAQADSGQEQSSAGE